MTTQHLDESSGTSLSAAEKNVLLLTCPCHLMTHFMILVFPAVTIPIMETLGMTLEDVVKLSFMMYLAYGLGALPAGYLTDRWQARKLLIAGVYLMGIGMLLAGAFPSRTWMPYCLLVVGIGASIYHPAGMAVISHVVRKRGRALAINGIWGNIGIVAAPFVTGVLTWALSWQSAFIIIGSIGIAAAAALSFVQLDETPHPHHEGRDGKGAEYVKLFLILCVALIMGGLAYRGNSVLLPAYLELRTNFFKDFIEAFSFVKTQGTATLAATILTSLVLIGGIFGQILGGRLADRYDLRRAYLFMQASAVPFVLAMAFTTDYTLALCAAIYMFFSLGMQPVENSLVAALTPARWRSTGFAIKFILTFGVGALAVYLVSYVGATYSLEAVYVVLAGIASLLVLSIIALIVASRNIAHIRN